MAGSSEASSAPRNAPGLEEMWAEGLVSDVIPGCAAGPFPRGPDLRAGLSSLSPAAARTEPFPEEAGAVTKELKPDSQPEPLWLGGCTGSGQVARSTSCQHRAS